MDISLADLLHSSLQLVPLRLPLFKISNRFYGRLLPCHCSSAMIHIMNLSRTINSSCPTWRQMFSPMCYDLHNSFVLTWGSFLCSHLDSKTSVPVLPDCCHAASTHPSSFLNLSKAKLLPELEESGSNIIASDSSFALEEGIHSQCSEEYGISPVGGSFVAALVQLKN